MKKSFFAVILLLLCCICLSSPAEKAARPVRRLTAAETSVTLAPNYSRQLTVSVEPADASDPSLLWSSSDESIAVVDEDGTVYGLEIGNCYITAKTCDGSNRQIRIRVRIKDYSAVLTMSGSPVRADFPTVGFTKETAAGSGADSPVVVTTVKFAEGRVAGTDDGMLVPLRPGEDTVTVIVKRGKEELRRRIFTILVLPEPYQRDGSG